MPLAEWTQTQINDQLNSGFRWAKPVITYTFPTVAAVMQGYSTRGSGFSPLTADGQARAELALKLWDQLIVNDMAKVPEGVSAKSTDIELALTSAMGGFAVTVSPGQSIWFNSDYASGQTNLVTPGIGLYGFLAYMHEIGHTLGLDHMGSGGPSCWQDSLVYTVMSYYGPSAGRGNGSVAWADWTTGGVRYAPQTPMMNDIEAIQQKYGAETTTRDGDTVYGFNSNITDGSERVFNFAVNKHPVLCIYDAGGIDTLDLSGFTSASVINLAPGSFSNCDGMTSNVSIARNTDIENAAGGAGADQLTGNALANALAGNGGADTLSGMSGDDTLRGGAGNDTLDGGEGFDTAVCSAVWDDLTVAYDEATGTVTVSSAADGTDTLRGIELLVDGAGVMRDLRDIVPGVPGGDPADPRGGSFVLPLVGLGFAETLLGSDMDDVIRGRGGNDVLFGEGGNDILTGGEGRDVMSGGAGSDLFRFSRASQCGGTTSSGFAPDVITDFETGSDRIDLSRMDAGTAEGIGRFVWRGSGSFTGGTAGEVRVVQVDKDGNGRDYTLIEIDIDGTPGADYAIKCLGLIGFTEADFIL